MRKSSDRVQAIFHPFYVIVYLALFGCSTAPRTVEVKQPYLWQFSKNGGPRSFLFGTMHVKVDMDNFPPSIKEKIQEAQVTLVETDSKSLDHSYYKDLVLLAPSDRLSKHISAKAFSWVKSEVSSIVSEATLERLSSYGALWLLELAQSDLDLWKKILPFKTPEEVVTYINPESYVLPSIMDDEIEAYANQYRTVDYLDDENNLRDVTKVYIQRMYNDEVLEHWAWGQVPTRVKLLPKVDDSDYEDGNLKALEAERDTIMKVEPELYGRVLDDRNKKWRPKILEHLKNRDTLFIAVGCLHMVGPTGLVHMLETEGYKVERIRLPTQ